MWREGPFRPPNRNFRNCNPGNLRSPEWTPKDADSFDIYADVIEGYEALWNDLADKFQTGKNAHGLGPGSTLADLFKVYAPTEDANDPTSYAVFVATWASMALGRTITVKSTLGSIWAPSGIQTPPIAPS